MSDSPQPVGIKSTSARIAVAVVAAAAFYFASNGFLLPLCAAALLGCPPSRGRGLRWAIVVLLLGLLCLRPFSLIPTAILLGLNLVLLGRGRTQDSTPMRRAAVTANLVLLAVSCAICLVGAEFAARVVGNTSKNIRGPHPKYLYTLVPGLTTQIPFTPQVGVLSHFEASVSSQGLRDREFGPKADDEFRILLLGDSFVYGFGLPAEEVMSRQLESLLQDAPLGKRITVINAGVSAYGPWQERGFLLERGFPLKPDLVILGLYPENDVDNTLTRVNKRLEAYSVGYHRRLFKWRDQAHWSFPVENALTKHSALYRMLWHGSRYRPLFMEACRQLRVIGPPPENYRLPPPADRPVLLEVCLEDWYPVLEEGWSLMEKDILGIQADCADRGVNFAAFTIPGAVSIEDARWEGLTGSVPTIPYVRYKDVLAAEAFFQAAGIPHFSVLEEFKARAQNEELYFPGDMHLNREGTALVMEAAKEFLLQSYFPTKDSSNQAAPE